MADLTTVRAAVAAALDEADAALGNPTTSSVIAILQSQLAAAQAKIDAAKVDAAKVVTDLG